MIEHGRSLFGIEKRRQCFYMQAMFLKIEAVLISLLLPLEYGGGFGSTTYCLARSHSTRRV